VCHGFVPIAQEETVVDGYGQESGFTMIEGLVAGGILAGVLLGISGLQTMVMTQNVDSKERTVAMNLGTEMIERIESNRQKVLEYHNIDTAAGTPCPQNVTSQRQTHGDCQQWRTMMINSNLSGARGRVTATRIDPDPTSGVPTLNRTNVVVVVNWDVKAKNSFFGQTVTTTLQTIIAPE
jgi:type IV pilus assembly protein PilV